MSEHKSTSRPVSLLIVGAGSRGQGYAHYATAAPDRARVVGVAEPRRDRRERLALEHGIPGENVFDDWRAAAGRERFADAVLICTPDAEHEAPTLVENAGLSPLVLSVLLAVFDITSGIGK